LAKISLDNELFDHYTKYNVERNAVLLQYFMMQQLSISEKTHYTNLWCKQQGIQSRDLDNHPTIDDAIILINFRNEFFIDMNERERGVWAAYWNFVYHRQFGLKGKHLRKLEKIAESAIFIRQQQAHRLATIKLLKQRKQ
jgi:hypothetical protein